MIHTFETAPRGIYKNLLLDPPWRWVNYSKKGSAPHRTAEEPYPTMSQTELRALPVGDLAAKDCVMFMWVLDSHLDQALVLGKVWGFTYKTIGLIWVKETANGRQLDFFKGESDPVMGMGKWSRKEGEVCLLFTRGRPRRLEGGVRQIIRAPRREHSRKPDEQYGRIERLCAGPRLELFARQEWPGWDQAGNEVGKFEVDRPPEQFANNTEGLSRDVRQETVKPTTAEACAEK